MHIVGRMTVVGLSIFLLRRTRACQVATFLVAGGVRRLRLRKSLDGPALKSGEWESAPLPKAVPIRDPRKSALVSYHPEYQAFDPMAVDPLLAKAAELSVGWLRTDIRWKELIPDGLILDMRAVAWYRGFLKRTREFGFQNMVVLSSPPDSVMSKRSDERLQDWRRFVEGVVNELGTYCDAYQLMNEPNNPVYSFFAADDAISAIKAGSHIIKAAPTQGLVAVNILMENMGLA